MASGIYSKLSITSGTYTTIASGPASGFSQVVTVSMCNRDSAASANIRLAICTTGTSTPSATDWLEYDSPVAAYGVLERTTIALGYGHILIASSTAPTSVITYGIEGVGTSLCGILGRRDLSAASIVQLVAPPSSGRIVVATVSICNRNPTTSVIVSINVSATPVSPAASDYLEYNLTLAPGATYERSGVLLDSSAGIGVISDTANVTAVAYGIEDIAS